MLLCTVNCELWAPVQKTDAKAALDAELNSMQAGGVSCQPAKSEFSEQSKIRNRPKTKQIKLNQTKELRKTKQSQTKSEKKENRKTGKQAGAPGDDKQAADEMGNCKHCVSPDTEPVGGVACLGTA